MSVQLIMEAVSNCVITVLEAIGALALLDIHWILTIGTAQVIFDKARLSLSHELVCLQIKMNVAITMEDVNKYALIMNSHICVHVGKDSDFIEITFVLVIMIFLIIYLSPIYIDIDECTEKANNCSDICLNTVGGYTCQCQSGYTLDSDNDTCIGK